MGIELDGSPKPLFGFGQTLKAKEHRADLQFDGGVGFAAFGGLIQVLQLLVRFIRNVGELGKRKVGWSILPIQLHDPLEIHLGGIEVVLCISQQAQKMGVAGIFRVQMPETLLGYNTLHSFPYEVALCPDPFVRPTTRDVPGDVRVISVGRLSNLGENPADDALLTMLGAARETIRLSVQDIGPVRVGPFTTTDWPEPVLAELGWAVARGVDVYVVLSTPGAAPDGDREAGTYGNGWEPEDVAEHVERWLADNPYVFDDTGWSARELVCEHFHAATLRFSDDDTWADGTSIGNHTKLIIVDDMAFYLGAQNLYPTDNAEFGLIVDEPSVTRDLLVRYWNPLWANSGRTAVSGREAPDCDY